MPDLSTKTPSCNPKNATVDQALPEAGPLRAWRGPFEDSITISTGQGYPSGATSDVATKTLRVSEFTTCLAIAEFECKKSRFIAPGLQPLPRPDQDGTNRHIKTVIECHFIAFDFDGADGRSEPNRWIAKKLRKLRERGIWYVACTSHSHSAKSARGRSRFRLILRFSRPVNASEYAQIWTWFQDAFFDERADPGPKHAAAVFYYGRPIGEKRKWERFYDGAPIDVDHLLTACDEPRTRTRSKTKFRKLGGTPKAVVGPDVVGTVLASTEVQDFHGNVGTIAERIARGETRTRFQPREWLPILNDPSLDRESETGSVALWIDGETTFVWDYHSNRGWRIVDDSLPDMPCRRVEAHEIAAVDFSARGLVYLRSSLGTGKRFEFSAK